MKVCSQEVATS